MQIGGLAAGRDLTSCEMEEQGPEGRAAENRDGCRGR